MNRIYFAITYLKCVKGSISTSTFTFFSRQLFWPSLKEKRMNYFRSVIFIFVSRFVNLSFQKYELQTLFTTDLIVKPPYPYFCRYIFGYDYFNPYFPLLFWVGMFWKERPNLEANVGDRIDDGSWLLRFNKLQLKCKIEKDR